MLVGERHAHGVAGHGAEMIHEAGEAVDASPLALRLIAFLDLALAEGWVEATGEKRSARAGSISVSWKRSGAKAWRRCHST